MPKKDTQFRPTRQESRADRTDRAAREIIRDDEEARQEKTEKLRAARLNRDKTQSPTE